jgi:hypothetical protein
MALLFSCTLPAQTMEMRTIPGTNLQIDFISKSAVSFEIKFNPDLDSLIKQSQITNPSVFSTSTEQKLHMQYGAMKADSSIPFISKAEMAPTKLVINGKEVSVPFAANGLMVYGGFTRDKHPYYDSICGGSFSPAQKQVFMQTIGQSLASFSFSDRRLAVGDTICRRMPMKLPLPGVANLSMEVTIIYKLREIKEPFSFFDLTYALAAQTDKDSVTISMSSSGNGEMTYDNARFYAKSIYSEFDMHLDVKSPEPLLSVSGHLTSKIDGVLSLTAPEKRAD